MTANDALRMWVVTERPSDCPGAAYVARLHLVPGGPTDSAIAFDTWERVVEAMEVQGLVFMDRNPADDPVIVGTWI